VAGHDDIDAIFVKNRRVSTPSKNNVGIQSMVGFAVQGVMEGNDFPLGVRVGGNGLPYEDIMVVALWYAVNHHNKAWP